MVDKDLKEQIHKHHIIPKHVGGSDNPSNLVKLTRLEHAWVHWLMWCDERKDVFNLLESKENYNLLLTYHHIIIDGWSLNNLLTEVFQLFNATAPSEENLRRSHYGNYLKHQAKYYQHNRKLYKEYWAHLLKNYDPLPSFGPEAHVQANKVAVVEFALSKEQFQDVKQYA